MVVASALLPPEGVPSRNDGAVNCAVGPQDLRVDIPGRHSARLARRMDRDIGWTQNAKLNPCLLELRAPASGYHIAHVVPTPRSMPPIDPNNPTGSASMANHGNTRQTHTGVNNSYGGKKPGLEKEKIMVTTGVYKVRTAALECQYVGYNQDDEAECSFKAKVTIPEKWLDNLTPVSTLKAFFMKSYRKKFPEARLSKVPDEQIDVAIKDESMFLFSKQKVKDDAIIKTTFYDRQEVYAMGPADWEEMAAKLKEYRRVIVRSLAHCHRSQTDSWEYVTPVTSSRQLTSTNSYVVLVGWYKMQCVIVQPHFTIADLKVYLHEKNGTRMPLECIDIGLRSGDDINIIDDALTLQDVYERTKVEGADYTSGPGTFADYEAKVEERKRS